MDEMQPAVLENQSYDSQDKSKPLGLSRIFEPYNFRCKKCSPEKRYWMMLYN